MGRGRKGLVEQSKKKAKCQTGTENYVFLQKRGEHYTEKITFNEHFIEDMKKMDPQDLMNILMKK